MNKYARALCEAKFGIFASFSNGVPDGCYIDLDKDIVEVSRKDQIDGTSGELWFFKRPRIRCGIATIMVLSGGRWETLRPEEDEITRQRFGASAEEMRFESVYRIPFVLGAPSTLPQRIKIVFVHGIEDDVDLKVVFTN